MKLTENKYVSKKPYRCSFQDKLEIEKQVGDLVYVQSVNKLNKNKIDPIRAGPFKIKFLAES